MKNDYQNNSTMSTILGLQCQFGGKTFNDGDDWRPDSCTRCHCTEGRVECTQLDSCRKGNIT